MSQDRVVLNPFDVLDHVRADYRTYVETFQRFQDPVIRDWVMERIENGTLLWKPPYIQLSRPFAPGDPLPVLIDQGLLHRGVLRVFRQSLESPGAPPIHPYHHQSEAVRHILGGHNVIVATGTGSGKSFAFGIPIVSEALRMRDRGIAGIKAVIVYPMNALANSQYDDFAARLHGSGLSIARYTGDTPFSEAEALDQYRRTTGRETPYDSEVLSRAQIQMQPPDILMTNYVMLELLLTRFEDRRLFATSGVLRFLVLDEVHTYTGKRGADVAALIRRLKQHTGTIGQVRCIATSATVESTAEESAREAVSAFARRLFGEPFEPSNVVTETYAPWPEGLSPQAQAIAGLLSEGPQPPAEIADRLGISPESVQSILLSDFGAQQPDDAGVRPLAPKLHAFFSQGRAISACLDENNPHLNDRGERVCPVCADEGRSDVPTFPLVFCRACGQEYWSVAVDDQDIVHPAELDAVDLSGRPGYLMRGHLPIDLPDHWLTSTGKVRGGRHGFQDVVPAYRHVCPDCGALLPGETVMGDPSGVAAPRSHGAPRDADGACTHDRAFPVTLLPAPFLLCPTCGIVHDRRSREYNKLFTFGSVGRSTATDVLVSAQVQALPPARNKVIAFSDNRQDTALQAAHMNSLHRRFSFRQTLYTALQDEGYVADGGEAAPFDEIGGLLFDAQRAHGIQPNYRQSQRIFGRDRTAEDRYRRYLEFAALWELGGTHRRTHQNLEDVGLLKVSYLGLDEAAAAASFWEDVPYLCDLDEDLRYDLLLGFLNLLRKRLAFPHDALLNPGKFERDVVARLNDAAFVHDELFSGPIGYSDTAERSRYYTAYRLTGSNTQPVRWVKRVFDTLGLPLSHEDTLDLVTGVAAKLADPRAEFLVRRPVRGYGGKTYDLLMVNHHILGLRADPGTEHWRCPKCGTVHDFRTLRVCTGTTCRTELDYRDLERNYFRRVYATPLGQAVPVRAEEHSGQVSGEERREIEIRFGDAEDPLNVLVCTPTMELGIDIGHLNAVTLRNVPPSPSNYAQRAGRAGRSGQPALITVFAGVGLARGPHDQYFYRFPEKMIAGAIAAPRFRLDNKALLTSHIHALVLETMGQLGAERLPGRPDELLDLDQRTAPYPLFANWRTAYQQAIEQHVGAIISAVAVAFRAEIEAFRWFTEGYIEQTVQGFVPALDRAMDRWRAEYNRLDAEREVINRTLGEERVDTSLSRRRDVIERKLQHMREGRGDWYLYRYLGGEGFLPGYAFPPQAIALSFNNREDELARDPEIALSEYAPGNFIYYRGEQYGVTHARPRRRRTFDKSEMELDIEPVRICPQCQRAFVGQNEMGQARCDCGAELTTVHAQNAMAMVDMYAQARARITADEEERRRQGYVISPHYRAGGEQRAYTVVAPSNGPFTMTLEHNGEILRVNQGPPDAQGLPEGFTLCRKCHAWLLGEKASDKHVYTAQKPGECPRHAGPEDLERRLWLTTTIRSDLALLDIPLPESVPPERSDSFYTTLTHTLLRALMVAFNLDEQELAGFVVAVPEASDADRPSSHRIVLYETTVGGSGVLASLSEPGRLPITIERARELLHEGDPEGGCERACYNCLLSFYNQRAHELLDRTIVLPWLQSLDRLTITPISKTDRFAELVAQCESDLERQVLEAMRDRGLPLPDEAQRTIYDGDAPLVIADFYYEPKTVVFVDGSPHYRDYVQAADERKRRRLKALGYRVVVVSSKDPNIGLTALAARLT